MSDDDAVRHRVEARAGVLIGTIETLLTELGTPDAKGAQIFGLLGGCTRTGKLNRVVFEYMKGDEEREARRILAELLRSDEPLSRELRDLLAALFDPDFSELADGTPIERQIVFRFRTGRRTEFYRDLFIRLLMAMQVGAGVPIKDALAKVGQGFGMEPDAVRKVWEKSRRRQPAS
jgi:hypothetical protein